MGSNCTQNHRLPAKYVHLKCNVHFFILKMCTLLRICKSTSPHANGTYHKRNTIPYHLQRQLQLHQTVNFCTSFLIILILADDSNVISGFIWFLSKATTFEITVCCNFWWCISANSSFAIISNFRPYSEHTNSDSCGMNTLMWWLA